MDKELSIKYENLKKILFDLKSAAVAFSAGVDSTFLLFCAYDILKDNVMAVIAKSHTYPEKELIEAVEFCKSRCIRYKVITVDELNIKGFKNNPENRCYLCKSKLFNEIKKAAAENNIYNIIEGSNFDDIKDYRPGRKALKELGILSPLEIVKLTKKEIRILSKERNLKTWNKSSFACLSSRFPYGEEITKEKLKMVEKAEQLLSDLGFHQYRVRIHGLLARIEIEENEFEKLIQIETRAIINNELNKLGFSYVSLDLKGYRTGSMNEVLN